MEATRIIMKKYALRLINSIQDSKSYIVNSADYIELLIDLNCELLEHAESEPLNNLKITIRTEPNTRISYIKQLISIAWQGVLNKDESFSHIAIEFDKIVLY